MTTDDYADRVIAVVREHLPLLDPDDLDELRDAIAKLGDGDAQTPFVAIVKVCPGCGWTGRTTSTYCWNCKATPLEGGGR